MTQRSFHISDVLTILSGRLVSTRHIEGVYDILGFMTDSSPFTHQLPRLGDEVKPYLAAEHPELAKVEIPQFDGETADEVKASINAWLEGLYPNFGTEVTVSRIPAEAHTEIHPLEELVMMRPDAEVIAVEISDKDR
ncbi:hypothetical protein SEA_MAGRITTE_222 [Microbacterium phage Magritte]|nr:hypothetical protein SEA_MAGRITTE_222 [Microbacterium phage Magritte]